MAVYTMCIKPYKCYLVSLITIICVLVVSSVKGDKETASRPIIVLNTTAHEPLSTPDQKGLMDQIAVEVFRRCGYKLVLDKLPAERALRNANIGLTDGELSRIAGLEEIYPNLIRVPEKIYDWYFVAFSKKQLDLNKGWNSLANQNIAYINGWKIYESFSPKTARVTKTKNEEQLFTLLSRDRTDIVLYHRAGGNYIINQLKLNDVKELHPPLAVREMFIYLNKKYSRLVPKLIKALVDIKTDGTYDRIMNSTPEISKKATSIDSK